MPQTALVFAMTKNLYSVAAHSRERRSAIASQPMPRAHERGNRECLYCNCMRATPNEPAGNASDPHDLLLGSTTDLTRTCADRSTCDNPPALPKPATASILLVVFGLDSTLPDIGSSAAANCRADGVSTSPGWPAASDGGDFRLNTLSDRMLRL